MEDKSTNEKVGIFIIVFLLSLIVIIIILYLLGIFNRRPNEANIIVDDAVMFKYSKKKWVTASPNSYSNYNWDKFKIYSISKNDQNKPSNWTAGYFCGMLVDEIHKICYRLFLFFLTAINRNSVIKIMKIITNISILYGFFVYL